MLCMDSSMVLFNDPFMENPKEDIFAEDSEPARTSLFYN